MGKMVGMAVVEGAFRHFDLKAICLVRPLRGAVRGPAPIVVRKSTLMHTLQRALDEEKVFSRG
jgi:hypothetical protein